MYSIEKRLEVKTVTTDLSSAMMLTVRTTFPAAKLVNDRFHVQQLMSEAVDQLRIRHRWEVLDQENKAIKEHRAKRKACRNRQERDLLGAMDAMPYGEWGDHAADNGPQPSYHSQT